MWLYPHQAWLLEDALHLISPGQLEHLLQVLSFFLLHLSTKAHRQT